MDLFDMLQKEKEEAVSEQKIKTFVPTTYHAVVFEPLCRGVFQTYDQNLIFLKKGGYQRYSRTSEVFTLLADSLEGKLTSDLKPIAKNLRSVWWEWCSLAWELKGNLLFSYLDPIGLVWDKKKRIYVKEDFQYTSELVLDIADKKSREWIPLRDFSDDFVEFHYGRKYHDLPKKMQDDAQIWFPPEGVIWPAGRGDYNDWSIIGSCDFSSGASRGVRLQRAQKSPVEVKVKNNEFA